MVIMVSALHLSVFLLIATLAATPSYYVMRRTSEGRAREFDLVSPRACSWYRGCLLPLHP